MHYDTTLTQAVAAFDRLVSEYQQLRRDIDEKLTGPTPTRLQSLALDALESEISSTIGSVKYKRGQARDLAEQQADQERERQAEEQQADATRQRLTDLTEPLATAPRDA